jgi:outer membrane protein OmpA-like peptidoglycan-associated protein
MLLSIKSFQTVGNEDIYVTFKQGDNWIQPINLGPVINTFSEEWAPFISADKSTLYFSSNGHAGSGSRDLFAAKRLDETWQSWSKPQNLGPTINTKGVELGYSIPATGDMAYFTTTQNSEGFGDIFQFPLSETEKTVQAIELVEEPEPEPVVTSEPEEKETTPISEKIMVVMTFQVLDKETDQPVDAVVNLGFGEETTSVNTNEIDSEDKKWIMSFEEGTLIIVDIEAEGYLTYHEEFVATGKSVVSELRTEGASPEGFRLTPNSVGTKIEIEQILFTQGAAAFADSVQAQANLDKLVGLMQSNPEVAIRLEGHTDSRGNPKLLKELSQNRVDAVKQYLVAKGIESNRIESIGFGGEKPIVRNISDANRQKNRRVEVVVTKN